MTGFDLQRFERDGLCVVEGVLDEAFVSRAKRELEAAIEKEVEYHGTRDYPDYGMVMLCALYGGAFWELFDQRALIAPFEEVLGPGCIVYAYTSSSLPPRGDNYSARLHKDCPRSIPGYVTNVGATIALDAFTAENGATLYMPGSHLLSEPPSEEEFAARAVQFTASPGSVCFFNALLWHRSTPNTTGSWRHALTINMCRPYMKQRLDVPRALEHLDLSPLSETARQKLGFTSQVPASYDEYYAPPEERKYRQKVE
jgi:ectoine hydroxylase-related dioxygenase (phytanoyl-CoA dioxygenase family)